MLPGMLFALHGNLGSEEDWAPVRGCGLSTADLWRDLEENPGLDLKGWGRRFARLCGGMDSGPALLGYSLGGRLALHAMADSPEIWRYAVIVSAHPGLATREERERRTAVDREWAAWARQMPWANFLATWNGQAILKGAKPSPAQAALVSRREAIARGFEEWSLGLQDLPADRLRACRFPVLWINGERDEKFTNLGASMKSVFPKFEQVLIPNCGHRVLFEQPDALADAIRDFQNRRL